MMLIFTLDNTDSVNSQSHILFLITENLLTLYFASIESRPE
jgi:hypothetical protein